MFSPGSENLLRFLHPWGVQRGQSVFPRDWDVREGGIGNAESVAEWFRRNVDGQLGGDVGACSVEENLAAFASLRWEGDTVLTSVNFQAVIVLDRDLDDFYVNGSSDFQYLRLDYDRSSLGPIFGEPLPHVHTKARGAPRFALDSMSSGNVVMDFLDFVYRNYFHRPYWLNWARRVWRDSAAELKIADDPLPAIESAFADSRLDVLLQGDFPERIRRMKQAWTASKDRHFPLFIDVAEARLLSYAPDTL